MLCSSWKDALIKRWTRRWASAAQEPMLRRLHVTLAAPLKLDPVRPEYHRASLRWAPPSPARRRPPPASAKGAQSSSPPPATFPAQPPALPSPLLSTGGKPTIAASAGASSGGREGGGGAAAEGGSAAAAAAAVARAAVRRAAGEGDEKENGEFFEVPLAGTPPAGWSTADIAAFSAASLAAAKVLEAEGGSGQGSGTDVLPEAEQRHGGCAAACPVI